MFALRRHGSSAAVERLDGGRKALRSSASERVCKRRERLQQPPPPQRRFEMESPRGTRGTPQHSQKVMNQHSHERHHPRPPSLFPPILRFSFFAHRKTIEVRLSWRSERRRRGSGAGSVFVIGLCQSPNVLFRCHDCDECIHSMNLCNADAQIV